MGLNLEGIEKLRWEQFLNDNWKINQIFCGQYRFTQIIANNISLHFSDDDVRKNVDNAIGEVGKPYSL